MKRVDWVLVVAAVAWCSGAFAVPPPAPVVRRVWVAAEKRPYIRVVLSADTQAINMECGLVRRGVEVTFPLPADVYPLLQCGDAGHGKMWCLVGLGVGICRQGTVTNCTWWQDAPLSTAPLPVLPSALCEVQACKQIPDTPTGQKTECSAFASEANVTAGRFCWGGTTPKALCSPSGTCPGGGVCVGSGAPCRMFANAAATIQEGATCVYP